MIYATRPIEQVDIDLAEDGKTVVAIGWTADVDDTAIMTMRLHPEAFDGDDAMAYDFAAAFLTVWVREFGGRQA